MDPDRKTRASFGLCMLLLPVLLIAGCGGSVVRVGDLEDRPGLETIISADVQASTDTAVRSVSCPSDVEVVPDADFECTVTTLEGEEATAHMEILNEDADIRFVRLTKP
ncbi:MAG: DUF4333 domain-containing protein [Actinomycetota bacterium]|nr:DUF4333 domain-containing protein [Actinomycetota bacterium]